FFDTKLTGDIMQRISDNNKIQKFLTSTLISSVFSFVTFTVFSIVIGRYSLKIFLFFLIGSSIYVIWILSFLKKCRVLNF
ncbi:UNVERIFIED_CONTAM: ABC transporter transmembrane domain-containing protein, partial [Prevotella sp. 15_C9]